MGGNWLVNILIIISYKEINNIENILRRQLDGLVQ